MTIWLLAVLLIASVAGLGYRQGVVRVALSFIGILFGALLAIPLGRLVGRLLPIVGIKEPVLIWAVGPILAFILISAAFKAGAAALHHKVDVYFKYKVGDLRLALWERLSARLGLCLGLINGTLYVILLAFLIYVPSYATFQVGTSDTDPKWMRVLNTLGKDLHSSGLAKVGRALDSVPQASYDMIDFGALLYHNPLSQARLSRYPAFLALGERQEFQNLARDNDFLSLWQKQEPIMGILANPSIQAIRNNQDLMQTIWNTVAPDLTDVQTYLRTARSPRYDQVKILGRWKFNVSGAVSLKRRANPTIPASEMQKIKKWMLSAFDKTLLIAKPDQSLSLLSLPALKQGATGSQNLQGQWKELDNRFLLAFPGLEIPATIEGDRMVTKAEGTDLVFERED